MRFNPALISGFLFTSVVLADIHHEISLHTIRGVDAEERMSTDHFTSYNPVWSGATLFAKTNGTFNSVVGTFTVPGPKYHNEKENAVFFTVILDGVSCAHGDSLLAGIYLYFVDDNKPTYNAWYAFSTDQPRNFTDVSVVAGDVVRLSVTTVTPTTGFVTVENLSNGDLGNASVSSTSPFCGRDVGWIVIAAGRDENDLYPLAKFEDVTFKNAVASGPQAYYTPRGADISKMKHGDRVLTSVSFGSDNTITIHRLG